MKKNLIYFMLIVICVIAVLYFTIGTTSDICKRHKDLYLIALKSGVVTEKFVDVENHSIETIIIKEDNKFFELLLVPDVNDDDFNKIRVNDIVTKKPNSFLFTVNGSYQFEFIIDCDYEAGI